MKTCLTILFLCGSVLAQSQQPPKPLTWQGLYVAVARTTTFERKWNPRQFGIEVNAIVGVGKRCNFQAELIAPVAANKSWLYRVQFGVRVF